MTLLKWITRTKVARKHSGSYRLRLASMASVCLATTVLALTPAITYPVLAASPVLAKKKVRSGKTQVIAKVEGREVTLNELRVEMARLNLDPADSISEKVAMQSILDRIVIGKAAKKSGVTKRPEALWRMEAAKERALAEFYMSIIAQPTEPTQTDVEAFMLDNPTLFTNARRYTFSVVELGTGDFNLEEMTPLFDETSNFSVFVEYLEGQEIKYTLDQSVRPASAFPKAIRTQLTSYDISDNIILQGENQISILKIMGVKNEGVSLEEGAPAARVLLRKENSNGKALRKVESLRTNAKVKYYRETVKPDNDSDADAQRGAE